MIRLDDSKSPQLADAATLQKGLTHLAPVQCPTLAALAGSVATASATHCLAFALLQASAGPCLVRRAPAAARLSYIIAKKDTINPKGNFKFLTFPMPITFANSKHDTSLFVRWQCVGSKTRQPHTYNNACVAAFATKT